MGNDVVSPAAKVAPFAQSLRASISLFCSVKFKKKIYIIELNNIFLREHKYIIKLK